MMTAIRQVLHSKSSSYSLLVWSSTKTHYTALPLSNSIHVIVKRFETMDHVILSKITIFHPKRLLPLAYNLNESTELAMVDRMHPENGILTALKQSA